MVQKSVPPAVKDVEPLLNISSDEFENLFKRTTGIVYSFKPVLTIAIALLLVSNIHEEIARIRIDGPSIRILWDLIVEFFFYLVNARAQSTQ